MSHRVIAMWVKYKHLKTGKIYRVSETMVINATNANDQQIMMLYTDGNMVFVREADEFLQKFEMILQEG